MNLLYPTSPQMFGHDSDLLTKLGAFRMYNFNSDLLTILGDTLFDGVREELVRNYK